MKLVVSSGPEQVAVPGVVGKTQAEAEQALTAAGLRFDDSATQDNDTVAAGTVLSQDPAAQQQVAKDSLVTLTISKGSGQELVPDVSGQTLSAAQAALQSAGFRIGGPTQQASDSVPSGRVIGTDPAAGTSLKKNAVVTVIVSTGVAQVKVPGVTGQTEADATAALRAKGFDVNVVTQAIPAGDSRNGRVLAQDPSAGVSVNSGTTVKITVGVAAAATTSSSSTTSTSTP